MKLAKNIEAPVKTKHSKSGYVMTFSPGTKEKEEKENKRQNQEHRKSQYETDYQYVEQPYDFERKQKSYVRA